MIKIPYFTKKRALIIIILIILGILGYRSYFSHHKKMPTPSVSITTSTVEEKDITLTTHAIGNVQPYISVSVKSRVDGQLLSVNFKEGDYVKAGQVIFQIDPKPYQVALDQAKANLARDQAQLENLKKLLERYAELAKKGFISKQDYDAAIANVKAQEATILADKATVENAQLNLNYCTIHAPVSGRTGSLFVHPGNLIKTNDTTPLIIINQIKPIYIVFSLPEQQLEAVKEETLHGLVPVTIKTKGTSSTLYKGELSFIDNSVDATTGMIQLKAIFANEHEEIWPGQYVDVILPIEELKKALLLPTRAIQIGPEGAYVFVVKEDSHVTIKPITLGPVINENTVISGLPSGTIVVNTGQSQLIEDSLVRIP